MWWLVCKKGKECARLVRALVVRLNELRGYQQDKASSETLMRMVPSWVVDCDVFVAENIVDVMNDLGQK